MIAVIWHFLEGSEYFGEFWIYYLNNVYSHFVAQSSAFVSFGGRLLDAWARQQLPLLPLASIVPGTNKQMHLMWGKKQFLQVFAIKTQSLPIF